VTVPALRVSDCHQANKASLTIYQSHCGFFYLRTERKILLAAALASVKRMPENACLKRMPPPPAAGSAACMYAPLRGRFDAVEPFHERLGDIAEICQRRRLLFMIL